MEDNFATKKRQKKKSVKQFCKNNQDSLQILIIQDAILTNLRLTLMSFLEFHCEMCKI